MTSYIVLLFLIVIIGLIIGFLYLKDRELVHNLTVIEKSIEDLNSNISNSTQNTDENLTNNQYKDLDSKIYEIGESLIKIVRTIKSMDISHKELSEKVNTIEKQLKLTLLQATSSNLNENEILSLYSDGLTTQEIAKQKRVPVGEVELVIKLASLHNKQDS
ncbi:MAG TPA: hypothetical protein EYG69_00920 [Campylobacterales bacterium]|nr:hypothetical protein [Campylobacterales bacterium]